MTTFNEMVYKYTIKPSNKVKRICEPLHRTFGIKHFWYSKTTQYGGYFSLASNPEMHDYYHSTKQHLYSPFFHDPKLIKPGFYSYRSIKDQNFQTSLNLCASKVNVELGACLVIKNKDELIRFGYATSPENSLAFNDLITDNLNLLKKFNEYFLKETKDLLKTNEDDLVHLPDEMGTAYKTFPSGVKSLVSLNEKCAFLEKLGFVKHDNLKRLSPREMECLRLMNENLSASKIALNLGLSCRTVENYLENIKNKLDCYSKCDLIKIAKLLDIVGYFNT